MRGILLFCVSCLVAVQAWGLRYDERARIKKAQGSFLASAKAAQEQKRYDEALDDYERALRLRFDLAALLRVGALYEEKGDALNARDVFISYQDLAPEGDAGLAEAKAALERLKGGSTEPPGRFSLLVGAGRMVEVPAGEFSMGAENGDAPERPVRAVKVSAFAISIFEVTNQQYNRCVDAGVCRPSAYSDDPEMAIPRYPVVGVSWSDAATYCAWGGMRLPTEAEWEKAARGVDGRLYPWGNEADCSKANYGVVRANNYGCSGKNPGRLLAVGSYPSGASPYGAMDMAGNAQEWTADWFSDQAYSVAETEDPKGPSTGEYRVVRGGGYGSLYPQVEATDRKFQIPEAYGASLGFRCVRPSDPSFVPVVPPPTSSPGDVTPTAPLPTPSLVPTRTVREGRLLSPF
jgi:formylglycine-generating enzyme required for sulfatase activity